jgi:hypothetical protein
MNLDGSAHLLEILDSRWPIIQAPMAGTGTPALAAAVSNAGGLDSLGVGTNIRAVALWESFGFEIGGHLPQAFHHPKLGYIDALVMFHHLNRAEKSNSR